MLTLFGYFNVNFIILYHLTYELYIKYISITIVIVTSNTIRYSLYYSTIYSNNILYVAHTMCYTIV